MKKIFFAAQYLLSLYACNKAVKQNTAIADVNNKAIPVTEPIYTTGTSVWIASPVTASGYVKVKPAGLFDSINDEQIKITKAIFHKDNSFEFTLYKKAAAVWMHVYGTFKLKNDTAGRAILITHALKGCYSNEEAIIDHAAAIDAAALATTYSNQYLFEKICFAGIEGADFLLLVNIDEHPAIAKGASVQTSWISKFYNRKK